MTSHVKVIVSWHNDKYYYSHRITLNKEHEKDILDEFVQLDHDGFIIHRKLDW